MMKKKIGAVLNRLDKIDSRLDAVEIATGIQKTPAVVVTEADLAWIASVIGDKQLQSIDKFKIEDGIYHEKYDQIDLIVLDKQGKTVMIREFVPRGAFLSGFPYSKNLQLRNTKVQTNSKYKAQFCNLLAGVAHVQEIRGILIDDEFGMA